MLEFGFPESATGTCDVLHDGLRSVFGNEILTVENHSGPLLLDCIPYDDPDRIGPVKGATVRHHLIQFFNGVRWQPNPDLNIVSLVHIGINSYYGI